METQQTFTLDCITINDMVENIFTTYSVKKKRKDIIAYYSSKIEKSLFDDDGVSEEDIAKKVDSVLKEDKNCIDPYLRYSKLYYSKVRRKTPPIDPANIIDTNYIGKAGECAVMSELLFNGYNVNNMMVDEGIDLVASKNNIFYYIQVKTTTISEQNKLYFKIKQDRFEAYIGANMRYILVARCSVNKENKNIYFTFTNKDIERFLHQGNIPTPADSSILSIKIEYDTRTGKAYLYDGRIREDISYYMNELHL